MARTSAKSVGISLKRLSGLTSVSFVMNQDTYFGIAQRQKSYVRRLNRECIACSAAPMSGEQQVVPSGMSTGQIKGKKNRKKQRTKTITPRLASLEKRTPTGVNKSTEWRKYRVDKDTVWVLCAFYGFYVGQWAMDCPRTSDLGERVVNGGKSSTKMMWWQGRSREWTWLIHLGLG